jgi:hypothetical protein
MPDLQPGLFFMAMASTVSTLSTFSTPTFLTSRGCLLKIQPVRFFKFGVDLALLSVRAKRMLKISIHDTASHRRLVVEGKLIAPWAGELRSAYNRVTADLRGREFVICLRNLTAISEDGQNVLRELMNEGVKFRSSGIFAKQVLKELRNKVRR